MNIAQELSIVRDNIAEYGMTNITQLEYDAIYEQGRADAIEEFVTEAIEKYKTYNCEICKRKDEETCTIGECTIAFLEQLKEQDNGV